MFINNVKTDDKGNIDSHGSFMKLQINFIEKIFSYTHLHSTKI